MAPSSTAVESVQLVEGDDDQIAVDEILLPREVQEGQPVLNQKYLSGSATKSKVAACLFLEVLTIPAPDIFT